MVHFWRVISVYLCAFLVIGGQFYLEIPLFPTEVKAEFVVFVLWGVIGSAILLSAACSKFHRREGRIVTALIPYSCIPAWVIVELLILVGWYQFLDTLRGHGVPALLLVLVMPLVVSFACACWVLEIWCWTPCQNQVELTCQYTPRGHAHFIQVGIIVTQAFVLFLMKEMYGYQIASFEPHPAHLWPIFCCILGPFATQYMTPDPSSRLRSARPLARGTIGRVTTWGSLRLLAYISVVLTVTISGAFTGIGLALLHLPAGWMMGVGFIGPLVLLLQYSVLNYILLYSVRSRRD